MQTEPAVPPVATPVTLSERAANELLELMRSQEKPDAALRVWVAGGGCSGFQYGMALDDQAPESDDLVFTSNGVKVYVDGLSMMHMEGSTVDYVDDVLGGGFKVENPNAVESCGCGSSFKSAQGGGGGGCCGGGCSR
jgi:iron-sulfur cluster assembly protein